MATRQQTDAVFKAIRDDINASGYGGWVKDDVVARLTNDVIKAYESAAPKAPPAALV